MSLRALLLLWAALSSLIAALLAIALPRLLPGYSNWSTTAQLLTLVLMLLPLMLLLVYRLSRPLRQGLAALEAGILNFADGDFSTTLPPRGSPETRALAEQYNAMAIKLRQERFTLHQRELILDKVLQNSPMLVLLTDARGRIVLANRETEQFFGQTGLEGQNLSELLAPYDTHTQALFDATTDGLYPLHSDQQADTYYLVQGQFHLHGQPHRLILARQLTRELARQEAAAWKKVIRVISHELNNSLAPISSMSHSGRALLPEQSDPRLHRVFSAIEERCQSLNRFIQGYATFAKLPTPQPQLVSWHAFIEGLRAQYPFVLQGELPALSGWFDASQMERAMVNLLKNAHESGSDADAITLSIETLDSGVSLRVSDRGQGMSQATLNQALIPFYSTKRQGTGLGLALCREIAEAHGGQMQLQNRPDGGVSVSLWLPEGLASVAAGAAEKLKRG
ncbi:sensor histidine kinase [Ferrimonas balearica]|uniref:sensor histidine kinase n=1 Tax=Ferrimonas balearica TaxID=44012 RepID=UPI001C962B48|nr:ATP-binding protein [Ferrimonas balearica]MBY6223146.1 HAMP domain-containing protein [Ferrimonas balearica]